MPHLDQEDIELVVRALEAREQARRLAHHRPPRSAKKRLCFVVVVIVSLAGADRVIHLEWIVRTSEMVIAAFFDWWFNVAKEGQMKMPPLPKLRRKAKTAEPVE